MSAVMSHPSATPSFEVARRYREELGRTMLTRVISGRAQARRAAIRAMAEYRRHCRRVNSYLSDHMMRKWWPLAFDEDSTDDTTTREA